MPFLPQWTLLSGKEIGPGHPSYIIAEIGSNHDGSLEKAKQLMSLAKDCGADAAKFQSFTVDTLINGQMKTDSGWQAHPAWEILDKLTLPEAWHAELKAHGQAIGIDFCSAPFDLGRLALLETLEVPFYKIASGDLTHTELLEAVAKTGKPVILSTGLAYLGEVDQALRTLAQAGCSQVALLHCVSLYPPQFKDMNIKAMATMAQAFGVPVGISDHTPGSVVPLGTVALGASVIEKHLTNDKTQAGPDHPYALDGAEFKAMVGDIRNLEAALGHGRKEPPAAEIPERVGARRAVYVTSPIEAGAILTPANLKIVRHAYPEGIPADGVGCVYGKTAKRALSPDMLLTWQDVE